MRKDQLLYDTALEAIQKMFGDTDAPISRTIENLQSLKEEIEIMIAALAIDADRGKKNA